MKKKYIAPVIALLLAIGGWLAQGLQPSGIPSEVAQSTWEIVSGVDGKKIDKIGEESPNREQGGGSVSSAIPAPAAAVRIPEAITSVTREGLATGKFVDAFVVKVTDGDTLEATYQGETHKVRLLCVDTPESVKQGVAVQEYAKSASEYTKSVALNKSVKLVFDKGLRDRYGRLLAYVIIKGINSAGGEDLFLNGMLVRNGYARVEIVSPNSALKTYFYELQTIAIADRMGMWGLPDDRQPFVKDAKGNYIPRYKE